MTCRRTIQWPIGTSKPIPLSPAEILKPVRSQGRSTAALAIER
jgi:hypothetical protein